MKESKSKSPLIGIVTVLYNSSSVLYDFFKSLNGQTYKNFILYVVDNKSNDDSLIVTKALTKKASFRTIIIEEESNGGIAKGNNIGINCAMNDGCEYILLSNNDILLLPNTINNLYEGMIEEKATIVSPKILFYNSDLLWYAGGYFSKVSGLNPHYGFGEKDTGLFNNRCPFIYAPTCFCMIHSSVIKRNGFFDENYFVYFDDSDFMIRAGRSGEKMYYIPESVLYHKVSVSTGGNLSDFSLRYTYRNLMYFALKHYNIFICTSIIFFQVAHFIFRKLFYLNRNQRKIVLKAYIEGIEIYIKYRKKTLLHE